MVSSEAQTNRRQMARHIDVLITEPEEEKRRPWMPNFHSTFRLLLIARVVSALHSGIGDCDETFNYWEPLHLLSHPPSPLGNAQTPFQTWEYAPEYAIRSWAYISPYMPVARAMSQLLGREKSASFYAVRIVLAFTSSLCEAALLDAVSQVVHPRVARYMLVLLIFSAGMYESATALLPSTFVMYTTTLAMSFAFRPSTSGSDRFPVNFLLPKSTSSRTLAATASFALGALLAWPFALVLAMPFVFEQLFLPSGLITERRRYVDFVLLRGMRWARSVSIAALIAVPIFIIDTLAYARPVLVPLNIIRYNILSAQRGAGPTLYGTEPWYYYLLNLSLNFGPALPLAIISLPLVVLLALVNPTRIAAWDSGQNWNVTAMGSKKDDREGKERFLSSTPLLLLSMRLLPFYIWLGLLSLQPHKEERFVYPAYPLLCFNAALGLYSLQAFVGEVAPTVDAVRKSASRTSSRILSSAALLATCTFCLLRATQTTQAYHGPFSVLAFLTDHELPRLVALAYPDKQSVQVQQRLAAGLAPVLTIEEQHARLWAADRKHDPHVDLEPLSYLAHKHGKQESLRLCYGKEWHRFPSTYLVPNGVSVDFIASDFTGILPKHFARQGDEELGQTPTMAPMDEWLGWAWPWKTFTRARRAGFNDMNREEPDRYVDVSTCDYLVDVDWPHRNWSREPIKREPRYAIEQDRFTRLHCVPFLDAVESRAVDGATRLARIRATLDRTMWMPSSLRGDTNRYGDYCLLRTTRNDSLANSVL